MSLDQDIAAAIVKLKKCGTMFADNRQRVAALGGVYMATAAESGAPKSSKVHKRYSTAKVNKKMRAPKGMGTVVATYHPGNLAQSMQVLKFSRAKTKVYVGSKLAKGGARGTFGLGSRTDGYYLGMVTDGTKHSSPNRFFAQAVNKSSGTVLRIMINEFTRLVKQFEAENRITI